MYNSYFLTNNWCTVVWNALRCSISFHPCMAADEILYVSSLSCMIIWIWGNSLRCCVVSGENIKDIFTIHSTTMSCDSFDETRHCHLMIRPSTSLNPALRGCMIYVIWLKNNKVVHLSITSGAIIIKSKIQNQSKLHLIIASLHAQSPFHRLMSYIYNSTNYSYTYNFHIWVDIT